jgi:cyclic pyranopterin phosphate synthase
MGLGTRLRQRWGTTLKRHPSLWRDLIALDRSIERYRTSAGHWLPQLIRPDPRQIEVAITSYCNLRCLGCRYGRDFMSGAQLPLPIVEDLLEDAAALGIWSVRFYGGEPLLHPDLPAMIRAARQRRVEPYVTTNGLLLEQQIDALYEAGLRAITIGFYGTGERYDSYVQRRGRFARLEAGLTAVRQRYGESIRLRLNWLLMRPSCNLDDFEAACRFAERFNMRIQIDLIHYSLPYFSEGPDRVLQFSAADRAAVEEIGAAILARQQSQPELFTQSALGLATIPDWLLKGPDMRVPCDSHQLLWVGADGTVQQCYVTYRLGNLHEQRLRDLVFTPAHRQAAQDSHRLRCPNCHCRYDARVEKHGPSAAVARERLDAVAPRPKRMDTGTRP